MRVKPIDQAYLWTWAYGCKPDSAFELLLVLEA
jgi:hypothetical protein